MTIEHELMMSQAMTDPTTTKIYVAEAPSAKKTEENEQQAETSTNNDDAPFEDIKPSSSEDIKPSPPENIKPSNGEPSEKNGDNTEKTTVDKPEKKNEESSENAEKPVYDVRNFINLMKLPDLAKKQSVVCNEEEQIHCSPLVKDGKLLEYIYGDARTQHEVFLRGLRVSNNGNCIGYRPGPKSPYKWFSYQEILDRAQDAGSGLIAKGAETNPKQFIGIFSQNRTEWTISEQACNAYSMVVVPLYDTLGPQAMRYIIHQCELDYVIVDKNVKVMSLLNDAEISLKLIVIIEEPEEATSQKADERGIELMTFKDLEELGKNNKKDFVPPTSEDLHTICFTSGTTGNPKGAMLSHKTVVADTSSLAAIGIDSFTKVVPDDVHLSYLPLAHMFEKVVQGMVFMHGASIGFFQGDVKLLLDDLATLKPTIFPMVPRLMNRVYDKIMAGARQSTIKKFLLGQALKRKTALLKQGVVTKNTFWDKIVFKKIQNLLGGRLRLCVTGAAPISPTVLNFMRCALGVPFTEGYGQTESTAGISVTIPGDYEGGNVGSIIPALFAKLVDVPEKNYFAKDNKGEVCVKGPAVFSGYYNDPEKTKQALDEDGWLHTGDVGQWMPNGSLKIFDRSKHIFKLAQGEYIAPEKIEQIYTQSAAVAQVFVHGDSLKASLVVVAVPDVETVVGWCKSRGINGSFEQLCGNEEAGKLILEDMNNIGRKNGLMSFELAKKIHLSSELFSVENDLLTPTFKSRRPQLLERYKEKIDAMYEGLD